MHRIWFSKKVLCPNVGPNSEPGLTTLLGCVPYNPSGESAGRGKRATTVYTQKQTCTAIRSEGAVKPQQSCVWLHLQSSPPSNLCQERDSHPNPCRAPGAWFRYRHWCHSSICPTNNSSLDHSTACNKLQATFWKQIHYWPQLIQSSILWNVGSIHWPHLHLQTAQKMKIEFHLQQLLGRQLYNVASLAVPLFSRLNYKLSILLLILLRLLKIPNLWFSLTRCLHYKQSTAPDLMCANDPWHRRKMSSPTHCQQDHFILLDPKSCGYYRKWKCWRCSEDSAWSQTSQCLTLTSDRKLMLISTLNGRQDGTLQLSTNYKL